MLTSFGTAVAAIVIAAPKFNVYQYYIRDDVCLGGDSIYHWPTKPPSTPGPEEADRIAVCIFYTSMLKVSGHEEGQLRMVAGRLRRAGEGTPPSGLEDHP